MRFSLYSAVLLIAAGATEASSRASKRDGLAASNGVLDQLYLQDKHFRRSVNAHLERRGGVLSKLKPKKPADGTTPDGRKALKEREKMVKSSKKKSDKLRDEYMARAAKEGRRTLDAHELREIQRILEYEDTHRRK